MPLSETDDQADYVLAVQAPAYALSATSFAIESAFAEHLRELKRSIGPRFRHLVLIAPHLSAADYASKSHHLGMLSLERDGIVFVPAHPVSTSAKAFWFSHAGPLWRKVKSAVSGAGVVHSGMSSDVCRPLMAMVNLAALRKRIPIIFIVDIDFRQHARDMYYLGIWSLRTYLINRLFHEPLKWLQVWSAPRLCSLVMLKSSQMVQDFGRGQAHVKDFYDTAHSSEHVLPPEDLSERLAHLRDWRRPLEVVFFGRLVSTKGIDRAVDAVRLARLIGADVRLSIIGDGPCLSALQEQVAEAQLGDQVSFCPQVEYGTELFKKLRDADVAIATPLIEDTPRAAFDAMARGIPIIAFDMPYFRTLAEHSGAVVLAEWPDTVDLARKIVELGRNRDGLAAMAVKAVDFARKNTQEAWLDRRVEWMFHYALGEPRKDLDPAPAGPELAPCRRMNMPPLTESSASG